MVLMGAVISIMKIFILLQEYFLYEMDKFFFRTYSTGLSKKMDGIWNRYNLKSTGRIYTFGVLKCSEKFRVLDLP